MRFLFVPFLCIFFVTTTTLDADAYGQLSSLESQFPSASGKSLIKLETVNHLHNLDLAPTKDKVIFKEKGPYLIIATFQVGSLTSEVTGYIDCWLVKNGKQVPNSAGRISTHSSNEVNVFLIQAIELFEPGDTLGIGFFASSPSLGVLFFQPDNEPAAASALVSILKLGK